MIVKKTTTKKCDCRGSTLAVISIDMLVALDFGIMERKRREEMVRKKDNGTRGTP